MVGTTAERVHLALRFVLLLNVLLALMAAPVASRAEDEKNTVPIRKPLFSELGVIVGYGSGAITEGEYMTVLIIAHIGIEINRHIEALEGHRGSLSVIFEPQFNLVTMPSSQYEFGIGIGIQYSYPVTKYLSPYILGLTGPQYISADTAQQANGFNFASAVGAGVYIPLARTVSLNLGYRYRHVSNANLKQPNGGINSQFGIVGISFFF